MFNPPHPGETLLEDALPALHLSIAELARRLGFARETLSRVLHGHAPISPDLAVRLELAGIGEAPRQVRGGPHQLLTPLQPPLSAPPPAPRAPALAGGPGGGGKPPRGGGEAPYLAFGPPVAPGPPQLCAGFAN